MYMNYSAVMQVANVCLCAQVVSGEDEVVIGFRLLEQPVELADGIGGALKGWGYTG